MEELQAAVDLFPAWKAILWCFYPIGSLIIFELLSSAFDDDDDHDGGKMSPVFQGTHNNY